MHRPDLDFVQVFVMMAFVIGNSRQPDCKAERDS
jgi:hypothetical protein